MSQQEQEENNANDDDDLGIDCELDEDEDDDEEERPESTATQLMQQQSQESGEQNASQDEMDNAGHSHHGKWSEHKQFEQSLNECQTISRSKIAVVTSLSMKHASRYKDIVHYIEKWIRRGKTLNNTKLPQLYIIDSICRAESKESGNHHTPKFIKRFGRNIDKTFHALCRGPSTDKATIKRVFTLWHKEKWFPHDKMKAIMIACKEFKDKEKEKEKDKDKDSNDSVHDKKEKKKERKKEKHHHKHKHRSHKKKHKKRDKHEGDMDANRLSEQPPPNDTNLLQSLQSLTNPVMNGHSNHQLVEDEEDDDDDDDMDMQTKLERLKAKQRNQAMHGAHHGLKRKSTDSMLDQQPQSKKIKLEHDRNNDTNNILHHQNLHNPAPEAFAGHVHGHHNPNNNNSHTLSHPQRPPQHSESASLPHQLQNAGSMMNHAPPSYIQPGYQHPAVFAPYPAHLAMHPPGHPAHAMPPPPHHAMRMQAPSQPQPQPQPPPSQTPQQTAQSHHLNSHSHSHSHNQQQLAVQHQHQHQQPPPPHGQPQPLPPPQQQQQQAQAQQLVLAQASYHSPGTFGNAGMHPVHGQHGQHHHNAHTGPRHVHGGIGWELSRDQNNVLPDRYRVLSCTIYVGFWNDVHVDIEKLRQEGSEFGPVLKIMPHPTKPPHKHAFVQFGSRVQAENAKSGLRKRFNSLQFVQKVGWGRPPKLIKETFQFDSGIGEVLKIEVPHITEEVVAQFANAHSSNSNGNGNANALNNNNNNSNNNIVNQSEGNAHNGSNNNSGVTPNNHNNHPQHSLLGANHQLYAQPQHLQSLQHAAILHPYPQY